jgi:hypothetical protein
VANWGGSGVLQSWFIRVSLPLVDSILKRGEDERDVKNGMSSLTNFESFFFAWRGVGVGVGVGLAFARAFTFACHVHAQGKQFQGKCLDACFLAAASLGGQCCTLSRVESPGMMCAARANLPHLWRA